MTFAANSTAYHLRLNLPLMQSGRRTYFATFVPADSDQREPDQERKNIHEGKSAAAGRSAKGQSLLKSSPPSRGITAPVTATLDFHAKDATLALRRRQSNRVQLFKEKCVLWLPNFSAPLSYYPPPGNLMVAGLLGGFKATNYPAQTGLYFLQPYGPRIEFRWSCARFVFNTIRLGENDQWPPSGPEIRKRYQFWVFAYPTGNPTPCASVVPNRGLGLPVGYAKTQN